MERIQAALKKARETRSGLDQPNAKHPVSATDDMRDARAARDPDALLLSPDMALGDREELWKTIPAINPSEKVLDRHRLIAHMASPASVPYDVMRTKLLHKMRQNKWTRVAITSPSARAGKTMTSLNLAFSLSRQSDVFSMLLELDMRQPALARSIGLKDACQFSRVLRGEEEPEAHMRRYGRNLLLGANQTPARNPAELLQGARAAHVIDNLEANYRPDIIILDTPPMFAGDDTIAFLDQVDCVLLIAEAERSTIEEVDKCEQELAARTNVLGVVLNKCRYLDRHEEYGKEYGY